MSIDRDRPRFDPYFMNIALAVRERANCMGSRVGAVLVKNERVIATGYNGTPADAPNCDDGSCYRCAHPDQFESGVGYDLCICVHAEQNALVSAARFGIPVEGSVIYSTTRPCFGCTKELLQAKIQAVYFLHDWRHPSAEAQHAYDLIQQRFPSGIRRIVVEDSRAEWAMPRKRHLEDGTGHALS
jgi:dCMP deaminase